MKHTFHILLLAIFSAHIFSVRAQNNIQKITPEERVEVVDRISKLLHENYIFPEVAEEMAEYINASLKSTYQSMEWPQEFAECVTQDLRAISNDRHLRVIYDPKEAKDRNVATSSDDRSAAFENYLEKLRQDNYGFKELKILDGNIGYLNLKGFINTDYAKETAVSAMNFLANSDAVIIDLRENGGGSPTMIQLISSYFFEGEPIHLNTFYNRPSNETWETWTLADIPGKRMSDVDLYILTSNYTFSAAEEFAYNLRHLDRATLIGETTGGGAHPVNRLVVSDKFMISLPIGRAINPVTNTNWEGVGVEPHVKINKETALLTAQVQALEKLSSEANDERKKFFQWHLTNLKTQEQPIMLQASQLSNYVGVYGPMKITAENGNLYYHRSGGFKYELKPLEEGLFGIAELPNFRVKFNEENNQVKALTGIYLNGNEDTFQKQN